MTGLLEYLLETGVGLALFYGLFRLALKNETHFQTSRFYLLASLVAAHLLPLVRMTSPFRHVVLPGGPPEGFEATLVEPVSWDWMRTLLSLYAVGAVFALARLGWHLRQLLLIARREPAVYRDGVRVVYIGEDCPPFSFFRTAFVHRPAPGDEHVMDQVVAHERSHIRQGHSLDILLIQLAAIGQWFNPFIWLYKRSLKELHEYLADREVLAQGFDPFTYRNILFEQHLGARSFEFAHHLRESQIKRRLSMMTRRSGRWSVCKYLLVVPALALLALVFAEPQVTAARSMATLEPATAAATPPSVSPQSPAGPKADDEKVIVKKKKLTDAELKEKLQALKAEWNATTDPEKKKEIEQKAAQLQQLHGNNGNGSAPDLSDPVVVEKMLTEISKKIEVLKAKASNGVDAAEKEKLEQSLKMLAKKREVLKSKLAELQHTK